MKKIMSKTIFPLIIFMLVLSACASAQPAQTAVTYPSPADPAPSTLQQATEVPTVDATQAPAATATVVRANLTTITTGNASQLTEENILGDSAITQSKVTQDGKWIACASAIGVRILDAQSLKEAGFLETAVAVDSLDISPDSSLLAVGLDTGQVKVYLLNDLVKSNSTEIKPKYELKAHASSVTLVKFSNDGTKLATIATDRNTILWNMSTGKKIRTFTGFAADISAMVFSPDDRYIAIGSLDGTMRVWALDLGSLWITYGTADGTRNDNLYPTSLYFSADDEFLTSGWANGKILTWQWLDSTKIPLTLSLQDSAVFELIKKSDHEFISLNQAGDAITWDSNATDAKIGIKRTGEAALGNSVISLALLTGQDTWVITRKPAVIEQYDPAESKTTVTYQRAGEGATLVSAVFNADGNRIISSGGKDGMLRIWDVDAPGTPVEIKIAGADAIAQITKSADNLWLAAAAGKHVLIYSLSDLQDVYTGKLTAGNLQPKLDISTGTTASRVALSQDGTLLAYSTGNSNIIQLWGIADGKKLFDLTEIPNSVTALAFSPVDNSLAAGDTNHLGYLWAGLDAGKLASLASGETLLPVKVQPGIDIQALAWSASGDLLVTGSFNRAAVINGTGNKVKSYLYGASVALGASAFSPDGSLAVTGDSNGLIRIYTTRDNKVAATLYGHSGMVTGLSFSAKGDRLISTGADGTIRLWSVKE
jgi:WD40 repeat protein